MPKLDKHTEQILKRVNDSTGEDYFPELAAGLAELLQADYISISRVDIPQHQADVVILWGKGKILQNFSYPLQETPCAEVFSTGSCLYSSDVAEQFPLDQDLADLNIQGYVGRSLKGKKGQPIGILNALFEQPEQACTDILAIFDLFAIRAGAELEIRDMERQLQRQITLLQDQNHQLQLAQTVFETISEGLIVSDPSGKVISVNQAYTRLSGFNASQLHQFGNDALQQLQSALTIPFIRAQVDREGTWQGEVWHKHKEGHRYPVWSSISCQRNADHQILHYIDTVKDMTSEKELEEKIYFQTTHDSLTGLSTRTHFHNQAIKILAAAIRRHAPVALVLLDVESLKLLNESHGQRAGDYLLQQIALKLRNYYQEGDILARLGGDEFAWLLHTDQTESLDTLLFRLQSTLNNDISYQNQRIPAVCSIGVSILGEDARDLESLLHNAETALHYTKKTHKGGFSYFTSHQETRGSYQRQLHQRLLVALEQQAITPHYQPVIDLKNNRISHCEVLARWQDNILGAVSPGDFIPIAETTGLIRLLGDQILQSALKDISALHQETGLWLQWLQKSGFPADSLCIELTESILMKSPQESLELMKQLKAAGVKLALDDFGTGYSSLSYLKLYPFDYLKIDRSFICDMTADNGSYQLVLTIIRMAENLGLKTIAEGIETQGQLQILKEMRCDYVQGFYFSPALPIQEFTDYCLAPLAEN